MSSDVLYDDRVLRLALALALAAVLVPSGTAFAVELPAGTLDESSVKRFASAIVAVSQRAG
jgi:hypothetical protein